MRAQVNDNTQKTQWAAVLSICARSNEGNAVRFYPKDATYDLLRFLKSGDVPLVKSLEVCLVCSQSIAVDSLQLLGRPSCSSVL